MRGHRWLLAPAFALGVAALALLAAGCRSREPVRIGIVISDDAVAGARLAATEINATGGIHGHPLSLQVIAGGGNTRASLALAAAESLSLDATVIGIVGHSNSSASLSAAQIYNARRVVQIAPTSSAPLLSRAGPYTFRLVASDVHQAQFLADRIMADDAKPRTALFFVNDDYGHALHQEVRARLAGGNVPVVYDAPHTGEEALRDVAAITRTVAAGRAELLVWLGRTPQLRQLLPALRPMLPGLRILASDGIDSIETEQNSDGVLTGVRYVSVVDPSPSRAALNGLRTRFRAATGAPLAAEAALTYDAVMLLATAARAVGTEREAIREYLAALGNQRPAYEGATAAIAFDDNGDPRPAYFLAEITADGTRWIFRSRPE